MFCPIDSEYTIADSYAEPDYVLLTMFVMVVLGAFCVVLWKVFVTNRTIPRGNVLSLGLDESSATPTELYGHRIPWRALFMYVAVGVTTFELGVFIYETVRDVQQWFSSLN